MSKRSSHYGAGTPSERRAVEHAAKCYAILSKHLPVTTTLAELIVLAEVAKGAYADQPVTVSEIVKSSGITRWAVSRIIIRYIESGAIKECKDPTDSRRNLLTWTPASFEMSRDWARDWSELM
ncbi:MarR family transcriptional regulator [Haloferula chungangensis]|uniref:MarR family transcriptional regulator n=1 Tax=Haloferula chungangensis TaxID=1048331 RepID=A0ABW2LA52_9BACT